MGEPPRDDPHSELLEQVADALEDLDLGADRDALLAGVREALEAIEGRAASEPTPIRPDLRVVEEDEPVAGPRSDMKVRVVTAPKTGQLSLSSGHIRVRAGSADPWQTVFRSDTARPYRLCCRRGVMEVAADGVVIERLHPGQTLDVEARLLRVRAGGDADARGSYARLRS